jgi:hypothetical protein
MLTGTNTDTISRNIKNDAAVKFPIRRNVSAFTIFNSNILEESSKMFVIYEISVDKTEF